MYINKHQFWLTVTEVSVHDQLVLLLLGPMIRQKHHDKGKLLNLWQPESREQESPCATWLPPAFILLGPQPYWMTPPTFRVGLSHQLSILHARWVRKHKTYPELDYLEFFSPIKLTTRWAVTVPSDSHIYWNLRNITLKDSLLIVFLAVCPSASFSCIPLQSQPDS